MTLQHTTHSLQYNHRAGRFCTMNSRKSNGKRPYFTLFYRARGDVKKKNEIAYLNDRVSDQSTLSGVCSERARYVKDWLIATMPKSIKDKYDIITIVGINDKISIFNDTAVMLIPKTPEIARAFAQHSIGKDYYEVNQIPNDAVVFSAYRVKSGIEIGSSWNARWNKFRLYRTY